MLDTSTIHSATFFDLLTIKDLEALDLNEFLDKVPRREVAFDATASRAIEKNWTQSQVNAIISGHIFLGNKERARDRSFLASLGVTDVLSMAPSMLSSPQELHDSGIKFYKLTMPDTVGFGAIGLLRGALHLVMNRIFNCELPSITFEDIGGARRLVSANGRCLFVHCAQGISRSATFVILYLLFRFFLEVKEGASEAPSVLEIVRRVQNCRQSLPNSSFLSQLILVEECLAAILKFPPPWLERGELKATRAAQFDHALFFCEAYLETSGRCMAETLAFLTGVPLRQLKSKAEEVMKMGLTVWSMKKSPIRSSSFWLHHSLILENFMIYIQQPGGTLIVLKMMEACEDDEFVAFRQCCRSTLLRFGYEGLAGPELTRAADEDNEESSGGEPDLRFVGIKILNRLSDAAVLDDSNEGGLMIDVPLVSEQALDDVDKRRTSGAIPMAEQVMKLRLPPKLLFLSPEKEKRIRRIAVSLGLVESQQHEAESQEHHEGPQNEEEARGECDEAGTGEVASKDWTCRAPDEDNPEGKILATLAEEAEQTAEALERLVNRFECKTWSLWIAQKTSEHCRRLSRLMVSLEKRRANTERIQEEKVVAAPTTKPRKRLRYEETDIETLRKEVERLQAVLNDLRRNH